VQQGRPSHNRVVTVLTVLAFLVVAEGLVITVLWLTDSISRIGLFLGMGIFAATVIAIIVLGEASRRRRYRSGA
jgi:hypothetical protein